MYAPGTRPTPPTGFPAGNRRAAVGVPPRARHKSNYALIFRIRSTKALMVVFRIIYNLTPVSQSANLSCCGHTAARVYYIIILYIHIVSYTSYIMCIFSETSSYTYIIHIKNKHNIVHFIMIWIVKFFGRFNCKFRPLYRLLSYRIMSACVYNILYTIHTDIQILFADIRHTLFERICCSTYIPTS